MSLCVNLICEYYGVSMPMFGSLLKPVGFRGG